jgi:hypothetical protein
MKKIVDLELDYVLGDMVFAINMKKLDVFWVHIVNIEVSMKLFEETPNYTAPINQKIEYASDRDILGMVYFDKVDITYTLCPYGLQGWGDKMIKALFKIKESDSDKLFFETKEEAIDALEKILIEKGMEEKERNKRLGNIGLRYL